MDSQNTSHRWLVPGILLTVIAALMVVGYLYKDRLLGTAADPQPEVSASPLAVSAPSASPIPDPSASVQPNPSPSTEGIPDLTVDASGLSRATVLIQTSQGNIRFKFYPKDAPNTVNRLIELIQKGFYNGHVFHRVVRDFIIQTGDPTGEGTGGSGQKLKAEFNPRRHVDGTLAMARTEDPDSADSQFYIITGNDESRYRHLNNKYTVFGQVIEGFDVSRKIRVGDRILNMRIE